MFEGLEAETVRSRPGLVAALIRDRIQAGEVNPGDRLPPHRELAVQLHISRATLNQALQVLHREGYVVSRTGPAGGTFVADLRIPAERWFQRMKADKGELEDILTFRLTVERNIAYLAAQRRNAADLARLGRTTELVSPDNWPAAIRRVHWDFHDALARSAKSPRLLRASRQARADLWFPSDQLVFDEQVVHTLNTHRAIHLAVRDRDPVAAAAAMEAEIEFTRGLLLALIA
jgi:GntR family transcriptional repressor for pyruvate dehydrogenase complex